MKKTKKGKRKIRYDRIIMFLVLIFIIVFVFKYFFDLRITNIYVKNNSYLTDQEIIEIAGISDYPKVIKTMNFKIKDKLLKNTFIKDVKVYRKGLNKIYIEVLENIPLFYYEHIKQMVLLDGTSVIGNHSIPTVLNYITDNCYDDFIHEMGNLNQDVLLRISEIKFDPNEVDDNRFFLTMNDGNYVYINIKTFSKLNKYLEIIENLPKQNGILYLDYGNNFEILED